MIACVAASIRVCPYVMKTERYATLRNVTQRWQMSRIGSPCQPKQWPASVLASRRWLRCNSAFATFQDPQHVHGHIAPYNSENPFYSPVDARRALLMTQSRARWAAGSCLKAVPQAIKLPAWRGLPCMACAVHSRA